MHQKFTDKELLDFIKIIYPDRTFLVDNFTTEYDKEIRFIGISPDKADDIANYLFTNTFTQDVDDYHVKLSERGISVFGDWLEEDERENCPLTEDEIIEKTVRIAKEIMEGRKGRKKSFRVNLNKVIYVDVKANPKKHLHSLGVAESNLIASRKYRRVMNPTESEYDIWIEINPDYKSEEGNLFMRVIIKPITDNLISHIVIGLIAFSGGLFLSNPKAEKEQSQNQLTQPKQNIQTIESVSPSSNIPLDSLTK